jgi:Zn-dependent peptidase ImmA (M78 family)/transcriptional regulator with XRE-family HTH domain
MTTIPERVRGLIEASGRSRHDFAVRTGLDDSKLSKSLSGTRRFSSLDLARIAEECAVTVDWLVTGAEPPLAVAARTTSGKAGAALEAARRYATLRSDMAGLGYPQPWRPSEAALPEGRWAEQGAALAREALARVEQAGRSVRETDLPTLVEDVFGADVAVAQFGTGFDGVASASEDVKLVLLATSALPYRQRFTLAHELCHLLAGDDQGVHLDEDVFDKAQGKEPSEKRANAFAAAFLMPEPGLREAIGSSGLAREGFAGLACELMVTPSALAFRLVHLRLIDSGTCERYKAITAADAAKIAGCGDELARRTTEAGRPRPPGLLVRDTYAAYEAGAATLRPYAKLLGAEVEQVRRALESGDGARVVS